MGMISDLLPQPWERSLPSRSAFRLAFAGIVALAMATFLALTAAGSLRPFYATFATLPWWFQTSLSALALSIAGLALYFCLIDLLIPDWDDDDEEYD
jgi:hypothetical protein